MRRQIPAWLALGLCVPGVALAQTTSDLMPTTTPSGARIYVPGTTPPAASPALQGQGQGQGAPAAGAPAGAAATGTGKGLGTAVVPAERDVRVVEEARGGPAPPTPTVHVVQPGETMWDIAARYLGSPYNWPKLWSYNPSVTNPHWIFPGDTIRLRPEGEAAPQPAPEPPPTPTAQPAPRPVAPAGITLRQNGFVEAGDLETAGRIAGSKEEKTLLSEDDDVYLSFKSGTAVSRGMRQTIYREISKVKHPTTGKNLGSVVEILGEMEVTAPPEGQYARGHIRVSLNPIERGDRVGPLRRVFQIVAPRRARADLKGVIVSTLQPEDLLAPERLVFIDLGKEAGVEIGNVFEVVRRGDGYQPLLRREPVEDKKYPREVIADILVVDVRAKTATGVVVRGEKEARVGDRVEARKGL